MTISTNQVLDEFSKIGQILNKELRPSTSQPPIFNVSVQAIPNTSGLDEFVTELERDASMAPRLAAARRTLGAEMDRDAPESLAGLRLAAGMSQTQLAHFAGTSQSHIARIELGQTDPGTDVVARIAEVLGVEDFRVFRAIRSQRQLAA